MKRILLFVLLIFSLVAKAQAPANYYSTAAGLSGAALKTELKNIISNGHIDHGYGGLWTGYQTTDRDYFYENDGTILDIYSENPTGPDPYNFTYSTSQCGSNGYATEGDCYNREHVVPQSLFNSASPMVADIHFIRATDGKVNGMRSNFPYGNVGTATFTSRNGSKLGNSVSAGYSGVVFEPISAFKGDIARMIFYFITRYESQLSNFSTGDMLGGSAYPGLQTWELNQLLAWNALDPVSPEEIARNNASYLYQGNRNPYIDNPAYVDMVWGTVTLDTQAPTAPSNLVANNPTASTIDLTWTAATDNIGVTGYDVYANNVYKTTVSNTSATVSNLSPLTTYTFYVIAKDAAGNQSPQSNTATGTTLSAPPAGTSCGTENFENIPAASSSYSTRTWTNNNITWTATDARTDETINNKAITLRVGSLTSSTVSGGIQNLTLSASLKYGNTNGFFNVYINNTIVGTIPYSAVKNGITTTTISNINITGNIIIKIEDPANATNNNRVAIDDLSWTCYTNLSTTETTSDKKTLSISPNPIQHNELFVKGDNLSKIYKAQIFDLSGKLIQTIEKPFINSNKINLYNINKGVYILKTDNTTTKFIVE